MREDLIEAVAADSKGSLGEREASLGVGPDEGRLGDGCAFEGNSLEQVYCCRVQELAANLVAGESGFFIDGDRLAQAEQFEGGGRTSQAAADDVNHSRRNWFLRG